MPFCRTAFLLSSVSRQQYTTEYWQGDSAFTAISPTSTPGVMGQYKKIGGITFGVALICVCVCLHFNIYIICLEGTCVNNMQFGEQEKNYQHLRW